MAGRRRAALALTGLAVTLLAAPGAGAAARTSSHLTDHRLVQAGRPVPYAELTGPDAAAVLLRTARAAFVRHGRAAPDFPAAPAVTSTAAPQKEPAFVAGTMPDITGDRIDDVFEVQYAPRRFVGRDGRSGKVLWTVDGTDLYGLGYARLGAPARPALLAFSISSGAGAPATSGARALDLRTGKTLWATSVATAGVNGYLQLDLPEGLLSRTGKADAVLIARLSFVLTPGIEIGEATPLVLDGANGSTSHTDTPVAGDDIPALWALPDLDGDGTDDYGTTVSGDARQLSARSGATGTVLWSLPQATSSFFTTMDGIVDLDGDRHPDVLVASYGFDSGGLLGVYGGASGKAVWTSGTNGGELLGDINRDGVADVETEDFSGDAFVFTTWSGRTGKMIWTHREVFPRRDSTSIGLWYAGDVDGDHALDLLFTLDATGGGPEVQRDVVILGRTGTTRPAPHGVVPLGAALVGSNAAFLQTHAALDLTVRTLSKVLWRRHYPVSGFSQIAFADTGHLSPGGGTDLLLTTFGGDSTDLLALSGPTGALRWRVHATS